MRDRRGGRQIGHGPEAIFEVAEPRAGLRAFLAIDSTVRGPAFGGVRIRAYAAERDALLEALDLAAAMTVKAALAELPCGGGKIVVLDHPGLRRARAFEVLGRALEDLGGRFFAGRDLGMQREDLQALRRATHYAADESPSVMGDLGDATARGTIAAIRAALRHADGRESHGRPTKRASGEQPVRSSEGILEEGQSRTKHSLQDGSTALRRREARRRAAPPRTGRVARADAGSIERPEDPLKAARIVVQGAGAVGLWIVTRLVAAGSDVIVADPNREASRRAAEAGARLVRPGALAAERADVFVPAALGGIVDEAFARQCRARIVCGPANNAIASRAAEEILRRRGILLVPDPIVGAGALIVGVLHHLRGSRGWARVRVSVPEKNKVAGSSSPKGAGRTGGAPIPAGAAIDAIGPRTRRFLREVDRTGLLPSEVLRRIVLRGLHVRKS